MNTLLIMTSLCATMMNMWCCKKSEVVSNTCYFFSLDRNCSHKKPEREPF